MTIAPTLSAPSVDAGATLHNILTHQVKVKVSSGTSKDARSMLDGSAETCWTSENVAPNSDASCAVHVISFKLAHSISIAKLHTLALTFAGGFSPISLNILASEDGKVWSNVLERLFPIDTNARQFFHIQGLQDLQTSWLRFELQGSTDEYGRVIVYQAEMFATC
ncbi:uncharacterized protein UMAG_10764 [Mycosarcoma maydis]|uniref:F5/8 type C domain-containing protein n=1 Tax=Mycosarcoma maydis TaxID=5270 RepID=A0A0D1E704_MYCMD|nr:uncharacterized protein UMAG_10764 [Ustilago maydis 521]KIS70200.1 hypothetical protein UMAG_10764 [Ustilago maydis 521]|eukprot:XP_011388366.1 hypothetical protein UMAG_10764 [Ustilago maydis 521]